MALAIEVFEDLRDLGKATRARLGGSVVAVSGGSTYESLFAHWMGCDPETKFIPVDERKVGLSQAGSNWMVAVRLLLDPNGLHGQALHWAPTAVHLDALVRRLVVALPGQIPAIDQVWLGMGDDGHTASLFPGGPELSDKTSLALETVSPKSPRSRVTLGLGALQAASDLCVVVTGPTKGAMLRRVLDGDASLPLTLALGGRDATLFVDAVCAKAAGI